MEEESIKNISELINSFEQNFKVVDFAIKENANLAAALLLSSYTEIVGGFLRRTHKKGEERKNYNHCLTEMGPCYKKLVKEHEDGPESMYTRIRCGLIHEYFIKKKSITWLEADPPSGCGIEVIIDKDNDKVIQFYPRKYLNDLKALFEKLKVKLCSNGKDAEYASQINLSTLNMSGVAVDASRF